MKNWIKSSLLFLVLALGLSSCYVGPGYYHRGPGYGPRYHHPHPHYHGGHYGGPRRY